MGIIDKINKLKKIDKTFFTFCDLGKILQSKKDSLKKDLGRMVKNGLIRRLGRNVYILAGQEMDAKKIAAQLYAPNAYISFESALSTYGISNQIPYAVTLATFKPTKIRELLGREIILRKIKKELFFGYKLENGIIIAEPEKALLDTLYMKSKGLASLSEEELSLGELSRRRFLEMSKKFPEKVQEEARRLSEKMR